ncbi:uncharacterized protein A1O5_10998 [Cladophialophora psammophila CBS 110553]|uniref:C6 zinc finger domain protein n=1 Tax=Cladophialophora psammophila CBS 110553 TaxID=1182543 RepID=W9WCC8_9EURO|nr:uncharacterized protein A1O5_10998 [Cladophialophora psammophila CBS 110553]EXJ65757.1 hypothetical protein A1O5_10998 [Cladophialophora psammophila CBS 110553]
MSRVGVVPQVNSSASLLSAFTATQDEWQAYRLYTQRISSTLGGPFDVGLWQKLIIQISHADAAVRNGVFCLGNLFRHGADGSNSHISICSCSRCVQALRSYNKAIASFANRSARVEDPVPLNAALASCALFICIEYYRKNDRNAIALIDKGCAMLVEYFRQSLDVRTGDIEPGLLNLFARLRTLSASFGQPVHWPLSTQYSALKSTQEPLPSQLERARSSLYDIMTALLRLRRRSAETLIELWASRTCIPIEELRQERDLLASSLQIWNEKFVELQTALQSGPPELSLPALILYGHFLKTRIYTEASLELSQDCYDAYLPEFEAVAEAAEIGLRQLSAANQTTNFSFESCFLGTLYLCALRCRQPAVRRRLVELMRLCREKEGLWHRGENITVVSRVMELEEGRAEFIPTSNAHIGADFRGPPRFHEVLCEVNYVVEGKTMVDATYVLYQEHSEHKWLAMKETLVVDG